MTEEIKEDLPVSWIDGQEEVVADTTTDILALKKELAAKYIDELKAQKEWWLTWMIIWEGKTLKDYLVSEWIGDKIMDNIKGWFMDKFFSSVDTQSFVIGWVTYASIFDYLKPIKEKIDNASTKKEIDDLAATILTASAVVEPVVPTTSTETATKKTEKVSENPDKQYVYPLAGDIVTSPKGPRRGTEHNGIDIWWSNTDIKSIGDGVVESVGFGGKKWFSGYGNYVLVKLTDGTRVLYGHMKKLSTLKVDDEVKAWDAIWIMWSTWKSTGPHLHLEIRKWDPDDEINFFSRDVIDPLTVMPVTKDMINPTILARVDETLLEKDDTENLKLAA